MKKTSLLVAIAAMMSVNAWADSYTTAGDGTTWTMTKLAQTEGTGVTQEGTVYTLANTVVVAAGDSFEMEGGITVQLTKGTSFEVEGSASMAPAERSLFTHSADGVVPGVVYLKCEDKVTPVERLDFEYAGLKYFAGKGLDVSDCTFRYHEASTSNGTSALNIAGEGAVFTITDCIFEKNKRAGIGGAANASNPTTVENCQFLYNDQQNLNYPQLNLTASSSIIIRNNVVTGDRTKTRGGGIMVADLMGIATNPVTLIENNEVTDNRYGIALYSGQKATVRYNTLINNNTETDPNNGGSGINVYDASGTQETMITGNYIEGSLWGVTIIGGSVINMGKTEDPDAEDYNPGLNIFYNNGNNDVIYDVYNNSANTVYAQGNYWKTAATQDAEGIENVIYHKVDNASLGEVIFTPWADETITAIDHVGSDAVQEQVYTLSGVRTNGYQKGINIVKRGNKTVKVLSK